MSSDPAIEAAIGLVTRFLRLVEERNLEEASTFLAPDVRITFPGGRTFQNLEDQVASSVGRFRNVRKVFDQFDVSESEGSLIVYCFGTLEGQALDGTPFGGVRFIDRFAVRAGLITDQKVWNDMGELFGSQS